MKMSGFARGLAVGLMALALVAAVLRDCPCSSRAAAPQDEHGCCAPPPGLRSAERACCPVALMTPRIAAAASTAAAGPPIAPFFLVIQARGANEPLLVRVLRASSPPSVLRI